MTTTKTTYAARTKSPVEKSKAEIKKLVKRFGARGVVAGWQGNVARIEFLCADRHIRISVVVPASGRNRVRNGGRSRHAATIKAEPARASDAPSTTAPNRDVVLSVDPKFRFSTSRKTQEEKSK
jgi:hypothetical protein